MDNNLLRDFIKKDFCEDEANANSVFIECDLYFKRYSNFVIGIYDYEDFRQIFILKILKLAKKCRADKIKNLNGYIKAIIRNMFNEIMRKNINYNKNLSIDSYTDNIFLLDKEKDFEEEYIKSIEMSEIKKIIMKIIDKLNDNEKDIVKACYFKELSIADYSRRNKINYYTCVKRLRRTESKILKYISKDLDIYSSCRR